MTSNENSTVNENLKVDENLEKEIEKAIQWELKDEDIERAKLLIGHYTASKGKELYTHAHTDAIRNWAEGVGDDNPLYTDFDYGKGTRWGSQIGHGPQAGFIKSPMYGDRMPEEVRRGTKGLFRGVHVFVSGGTWDWYRPIYPGDKIYCYEGAESIEEKKSEYADKSVIRVGRSVNLNQHGEVIGVYRTLTVNTARKKSREKGKYAEIKAATYTDEDYEKIDAIYAAEKARGAEKRYFEDVQIGEELSPMVKGPLTVTDIQAFHMGGYGQVPYGLRAGRLGYTNRKRIKPFYVKNEQGIYDVAQRLHWDSEWAKGIGNPMAYDYGVLRQCWLYHYVSDWMGDDSFIERLEDSIRKFNFMGDTQFLSGKVVNKREEDGRYLVDLELHMINQSDVESAYGSATVSLPSREAGLSTLPDVPIDLKIEAARMFARHNELKAEAEGG